MPHEKLRVVLLKKDLQRIDLIDGKNKCGKRRTISGTIRGVTSTESGTPK